MAPKTRNLASGSLSGSTTGRIVNRPVATRRHAWSHLTIARHDETAYRIRWPAPSDLTAVVRLTARHIVC